jgi:hypothetical protein
MRGVASAPSDALRYEIPVRGRLSDAALASFEGLAARAVAQETVLEVPIGDHAELHGVLDRVQALGVELLELRRLP